MRYFEGQWEEQVRIVGVEEPLRQKAAGLGVLQTIGQMVQAVAVWVQNGWRSLNVKHLLH